MMRGALLVVAVAAMVTAMDLPAPRLHKHAQLGLEISIDDVPGVEYKHIKYSLDGQTHRGELQQAADGRWYQRNSKVSYDTGKVYYKIVVEHQGQVLNVKGTINVEHQGQVLNVKGTINVEHQGQVLNVKGTINVEHQGQVLNVKGTINVEHQGQVLNVKGTINVEHQGQVLNVKGTINEAASAAAALSSPIRRAGHTVMRDDFSGSNINTAYWTHEVSMYGGYNWEIQAYTNDPLNVYQKNGHLFLRPTLTSDKFGEQFLHSGTMDMTKLWGLCTNADRYGCVREGRYGLLPPVMSGKLKSKPTIRFGHVEVRARVPCGDWIWPALWMLPRDSRYGGWPRSGEIDIMESRGNSRASDGHVNHGNTEVSSTLHWGPDAGQNKYTLTHGERRGDNFCGSMHTYKLDWTIDHIVVSVDDHVVTNVNIQPGGFWQKGGFSGNNLWSSGTKAAPFDEQFYMIMNVAVGGTNGFFPDNWQYNSPKPWNNNSPTEDSDFWNKRHDWLPSWQGEQVAMEVDYIQMDQY